VVLPLALGATVYLFLRPRRAFFLGRLLETPVLGGAIQRVRAFTVPLGRLLPSRLLGVFPDFAWAFAVSATLALLWRGRPGPAKILWCATGAALVVGYEIAQRYHLVPGTFDGQDLAAQIAGYALGWLLHPPRRSAN